MTFDASGNYIPVADTRNMSQKVHQLDLSLQHCCYNILVLVCGDRGLDPPAFQPPSNPEEEHLES